MDGKNLMNVYENPKSSLHHSLSLINVWGKEPTHALGVVTEGMKYLYWGYAAKGFKPNNELYDLKTDPLELTNQFTSSDYTKARIKMQKLYHQHLAHWKENAVAYNNYQNSVSFLTVTLSGMKKSNGLRTFHPNKK